MRAQVRSGIPFPGNHTQKFTEAQRREAGIPGAGFSYDHARSVPFAALISVRLPPGEIYLIIEWEGDFAQ
jgi:hypothetical protein